MPKGELVYFNHEINGRVYGAWYREISPVEVEVIGAGFMNRASFAGFDALSVARSVLETYVRNEAKNNSTVPPWAPLDEPPPAA